MRTRNKHRVDRELWLMLLVFITVLVLIRFFGVVQTVVGCVVRQMW